MNRKEGYYWVKYEGNWNVGKFQKGIYSWYLVGYEEYFTDGHFDEIDENRIERDRIINGDALVRAIERGRKETDDLAHTCRPTWRKNGKTDNSLEIDLERLKDPK